MLIRDMLFITLGLNLLILKLRALEREKINIVGIIDPSGVSEAGILIIFTV
jgi:hypothetical protein